MRTPRLQRRLRLSDLTKRFNGFSTPFGGVQWVAPVAEADTVRALLTTLEDRRALFAPYHVEVEFAVARSIEEVRQACTTAIASLPQTSRATPSIRAVRAACRRFLSEAPDAYELHRGYGDAASAAFFTALGELRALIGVQVLALASGYGIELEPDLASIMPPAEEEGDEDAPG